MVFKKQDNSWYEDLCTWLGSKQSLKSLKLLRLNLPEEIVPLLASAIQQVEELEFSQFCAIQPIECILSLPNLTSVVSNILAKLLCF
jgi:hypothetical protein